MSETAELTRAEIDVLCMEMEHSPGCIWSQGSPVCYVDAAGNRWEDKFHIRPWVPPDCTCGYFALMYRARAKLRGMRERASA